MEPVDPFNFRHRLEGAYRTLASIFPLEDSDRIEELLGEVIDSLIDIDSDFFPEAPSLEGAPLCENCGEPTNDICHPGTPATKWIPIDNGLNAFGIDFLFSDDDPNNRSTNTVFDYDTD